MAGIETTITRQITETYSLFFIEEEPEIITAKVLSEYLFYLSSLNALLLKYTDDFFPNANCISYETIQENLDLTVTKVYEFAETELAEELYNLKFDEYELQVEGATKNSPFAITLSGIVLLLAVAVVISGGEIETDLLKGQLRAKLPPIADGLERIKALFRN